MYCYSMHKCCMCGRCRHQMKCNVHRRIAKFKTWFEFQSPCEHLQVEPRLGCLHYKQNIKIALIFRPTLSQEQIYAKALETKVEHLKWMKVQELLDQYYKAKEKKDAMKKNIKESAGKQSTADNKSMRNKAASTKTKVAKDNKGPKRTVISTKSTKNKTSITTKKSLKKKDSGPLAEVTIDPATVVLTEDDLRMGKTLLLKYLEAKTRTVTVKCLLQTQLCPDSDERQMEVAELQVVCTTVPPCIAVSSSTCLDFGPTALGSRSKLRARLTNVSFFDTPVVLSTLSPVGLFSCTTALEKPLKMFKHEVVLPPEHILTIPILFDPNKEGKVMERFEITSGTSVLQLHARGDGVVPSFKLSPEQEVFNLACAAGKKADVTLSITNTCKASLPFNINEVFLKKGRALPTNTPTSPDFPNSEKKKDKPLKQKKIKAQKQFDSMAPELINCLLTDFVDVHEDTFSEPVFKLTNVNESFDVLSEETKAIVIRFTPPKNVINQGGPDYVSVGRKISKSPKPNKSVSKQIKSAKDTDNKKKSNKKIELDEFKTDGDNIKNNYNIYAIKYELYFANVKKIKDFIILAVVKFK